MLMDTRPNDCLPHYDRRQCEECGRVEVHRVHAEHPTRGQLLVCGLCARMLLTIGPRDPFA